MVWPGMTLLLVEGAICYPNASPGTSVFRLLREKLFVLEAVIQLHLIQISTTNFVLSYKKKTVLDPAPQGCIQCFQIGW